MLFAVFADIEHMAGEGDELRAPIVGHGVRMYGEAGTLHAAAVAEEIGQAFRRLHVKGIAMENVFTIGQCGSTLGPYLQRLVHLGLVGLYEARADLDGYIASEYIAAGVFIE